MMNVTVENLQEDSAAQTDWKWDQADRQVNSQERADKLWEEILLLFSVKKIDAVEKKMWYWKKSMKKKK